LGFPYGFSVHFLAINLENLSNAVSHLVRNCVDLYHQLLPNQLTNYRLT
jgi:hypothetical protein